MKGPGIPQTHTHIHTHTCLPQRVGIHRPADLLPIPSASQSQGWGSLHLTARNKQQNSPQNTNNYSHLLKPLNNF